MFAGIGSRRTPQDILDLMFQIGYSMARIGEYCATGACIGPDQAFANGCVAAGGIVRLSLPWWKYEADWRYTIPIAQRQEYVIQESDTAAYKAVEDFHPSPGNLSQGARKLMGRNYLILLPPVKQVICHTPNGDGSGGTGQAMRIATHYGLPVWDLGLPHVRQRWENWVNTGNW